LVRYRAAQVFVANPNKTPKIAELLQHNKDKLLRYLGDFHTDKGVLDAGCAPSIAVLAKYYRYPLSPPALLSLEHGVQICHWHPTCTDDNFLCRG
jgi:hypothetical protein